MKNIPISNLWPYIAAENDPTANIKRAKWNVKRLEPLESISDQPKRAQFEKFVIFVFKQ